MNLETLRPEWERVCDTCELAPVCPHHGTSPTVFADGSELKCVVVNASTKSTSVLIPENFTVSRKGEILDYRISVHRFYGGSIRRFFKKFF